MQKCCNPKDSTSQETRDSSRVATAEDLRGRQAIAPVDVSLGTSKRSRCLQSCSELLSAAKQHFQPHSPLHYLVARAQITLLPRPWRGQQVYL